MHSSSYQIHINIIVLLITALSSSGRDVYALLTPITASYDRSSQVVWQDWHTPVCNCSVKKYRWRDIWMQMAANGTEHKLRFNGEREPSQKSRSDFMTRHSPPIKMDFKHFISLKSAYMIVIRYWELTRARARMRLKLKSLLGMFAVSSRPERILSVLKCTCLGNANGHAHITEPSRNSGQSWKAYLA